MPTAKLRHPDFAYHKPAANTLATVNIAKPTGKAAGTLFLNHLSWSYSAAPTGGALTIEKDGTEIAKWAITAAGPGVLVNGATSLALRDISTDIDVKLAAGGAGVEGVVNIGWDWR